MSSSVLYILIFRQLEVTVRTERTVTNPQPMKIATGVFVAEKDWWKSSRARTTNTDNKTEAAMGDPGVCIFFCYSAIVILYAVDLA